MKKIIIALSLVGVISLLGFGVVMAQEGGQGPKARGCPNCPFADGEHPLHEYMSEAFANALGITVEEFYAYREEGLTFFGIASQLNLDLESLSASMTEIRTEAIEHAFADGVLTQEQYEYMLQHAGVGGGRFGGGMGNGGGFGRHQGGNFGQGKGGGGGYGYQNCPNGLSSDS